MIALFALTVAMAAPVMAQEAPIVAVPAPPVATPDADRIASATRLLTAMKIDRQYDSLLAQMIPLMTAQVFQQVRDSVTTADTLRDQLEDPAQLKQLQQSFATEATKEFRARYGTMRIETAREYARVFTTVELDELTAFYETPVGRKSLEVMPQLQERLFPIGMRVGAEVGQAAMKTTLGRISLDAKRPNT